MIKLNTAISIVGAGNVATRLASAFNASNVSISHISSRTIESSSTLADSIGATACRIDELPESQLTVVCVSDDLIPIVLKKINPAIPVAYTSGSVSIETLPKRAQIGVFYPLQTLTKERETILSDVPFFIEANSKEFCNQLVELAKKISSNVSIATSEERSKIHLTAVFVNNFVNHILYHAKAYADDNNVNFDHLMPLLFETIEKIKSNAPSEVQTGPARRGDKQTIQTQTEALTGETKKIYEVLTESIIKTYLK